MNNLARVYCWPIESAKPKLFDRCIIMKQWPLPRLIDFLHYPSRSGRSRNTRKKRLNTVSFRHLSQRASGKKGGKGKNGALDPASQSQPSLALPSFHPFPSLSHSFKCLHLVTNLTTRLSWLSLLFPFDAHWTFEVVRTLLLSLPRGLSYLPLPF